MSGLPKNMDSSIIAQNAAEELTCDKHYLEYTTCMQKKKANYADCVKMLDSFQYCLIYHEDKRTSQKKKKVLNPKF